DYGWENECADCGGVGYVRWHYG
ncbi:hypothetical protein A2U01_0100215, partial [Trifolium medium]|nr:hypothetical protein [Trifolium medium]